MQVCAPLRVAGGGWVPGRHGAGQPTGVPAIFGWDGADRQAVSLMATWSEQSGLTFWTQLVGGGAWHWFWRNESRLFRTIHTGNLLFPSTSPTPALTYLSSLLQTCSRRRRPRRAPTCTSSSAAWPPTSLVRAAGCQGRGGGACLTCHSRPPARAGASGVWCCAAGCWCTRMRVRGTSLRHLHPMKGGCCGCAPPRLPVFFKFFY